MKKVVIVFVFIGLLISSLFGEKLHINKMSMKDVLKLQQSQKVELMSKKDYLNKVVQKTTAQKLKIQQVATKNLKAKQSVIKKVPKEKTVIEIINNGIKDIKKLDVTLFKTMVETRLKDNPYIDKYYLHHMDVNMENLKELLVTLKEVKKYEK